MTIAGASTTLEVSAASAQSSPLSYDWSVISHPGGAATPIFSTNDSDDADTPTIAFSKDGTYHLAVTVSDNAGNAATRDVDVVVQQVATSLRVTPHGDAVKRGKHATFDVTVLDQFGHAMRAQSTAQNSVASGNGTIHTDGLFTAGKKKGRFTIDVEADDLSATVAGTVV